MGPNILHGPHQDAQKSTNARSVPPTTASKFSAVNSTVATASPFIREESHRAIPPGASTDTRAGAFPLGSSARAPQARATPVSLGWAGPRAPSAGSNGPAGNRSARPESDHADWLLRLAMRTPRIVLAASRADGLRQRRGLERC